MVAFAAGDDGFMCPVCNAGHADGQCKNAADNGTLTKCDSGLCMCRVEVDQQSGNVTFFKQCGKTEKKKDKDYCEDPVLGSSLLSHYHQVGNFVPFR